MYKVFGKQGITKALHFETYEQAQKECKKMAQKQKAECHVYKGEQWMYSYGRQYV